MLSTNCLPTKIGVGCLISKRNEFLLGRRLNSHGAGSWSFPGGHLEDNETPLECALRETHEETGLIVKNPINIGWSFDTFPEKNCNYITLFVKTDFDGGTPSVMEPHKSEEWLWFSQDKLPNPLFKPLISFFSTSNVI